jgi:hypothetical protein
MGIRIDTTRTGHGFTTAAGECISGSETTAPSSPPFIQWAVGAWWPQYAMNARARHKCPFLVIVATPSSTVARWAGQPINVGNGTVFRQHIIGQRHPVLRITVAVRLRNGCPSIPDAGR